MFDDPMVRVYGFFIFVLIVCAVMGFVAAWYIDRD